MNLIVLDACCVMVGLGVFAAGWNSKFDLAVFAGGSITGFYGYDLLLKLFGLVINPIMLAVIPIGIGFFGYYYHYREERQGVLWVGALGSLLVFIGVIGSLTFLLTP